MIVQSLDGERVVAGFQAVELQLAHCLAAQHIQFPTLRTERFFEREHLRSCSVNAHAEPYVALVVGLRGYESHAEHSVAVLFSGEAVCQFTVLGQSHCVHAVAEHLHRLRTGRSLLVVAGVAGYRSVGVQRMGFALRGFRYILVNLLVCQQRGQRRREEHRQVSRTHVHRPLPLASGHRVVVVSGERAHLLICLLALGRGGVEAVVVVEHALERVAALHERTCALGFEHLPCMSLGGKHGIFDCSKVGILQFGTYGRLHLLDLFGHGSVAFEVAVKLVAKLRRGEIRVGRRTKSARIGFFVQLHLVPSHELRPALAAQTVELIHGREQLLAGFVAKHTAEPVLIVLVEGGSIYAVDVPCHVEKQFEVVAGHLGVVHVHYPELAHIVVVGSAHLVVHQSRLCGCQPQIVVRTTPVAEVIVHATAAAALLLLGIGEAGHVAIVVVAPHQRHIVGHFQSLFVNLQHLFIWYEHLHLLRRVADILADELLLVVNHLLQGVELLGHGLHAFHRAVVYAAHSDGEHVAARRAFDLLEPLRPVVLHGLFVGDIVEPAALLLVPFVHVVAQQRFAVRRTDGYAATVGHGLCARNLEECRGSGVHARPDGVGSEAHEQLEHAAIGVAAYRAEGGFVVGRIAPGTQTPVFVINKNAAKFHRSALQSTVVAVYNEPVAPLRLHVAPPYPRVNAGHAREFEQSVGRTATVSSHHGYLVSHYRQTESVGLLRQFVHVNAALCQFLSHRGRSLVEFHYAYGSRLFASRHGLLASHGLHVVGKHCDGCGHHGFRLLRRAVCHGLCSVIPHHVCRHGRRRVPHG